MNSKSSGDWTVELSPKAKRQIGKLKKEFPKIYATAATLFKEIEVNGPWRSNWPNYGPLKGKGDSFHCHIKKGKPTYVACWSIENKTIKLVEISYVGTHEKAPY